MARGTLGAGAGLLELTARHLGPAGAIGRLWSTSTMVARSVSTMVKAISTAGYAGAAKPGIQQLPPADLS